MGRAYEFRKIRTIFMFQNCSVRPRMTNYAVDLTEADLGQVRLG